MRLGQNLPQDVFGDGLLHSEQLVDPAIERVGPHGQSAASIDQLHGHSQPVALSADTAFDNMGDVQLFGGGQCVQAPSDGSY